MLLPLDMHAHIELDIAPLELDHLGACVVAVTRSLGDFAGVVSRRDPSVVWGVGCHPALAKAVEHFSPDAFRAALPSTAVVGEVGLDGGSKVPLSIQQAVFDDVLEALKGLPRVVSVHSYRATTEVLNTIERHHTKGVVLHWWLGTEEETSRAVALGSYFSINASQAGKWKALRAVPPDRLLTETDHPFGDRGKGLPRRPGNVGLVERRLRERLGLQPDEVRRLVWHNLSGLLANLQVHELLPHQFRVQLLAA